MKLFRRLSPRHKIWLMPIVGVLSALGFAPWGIWPLTLICVAILAYLVSSAGGKGEAFKLGWLFAVGHFCWGLQWIAVAFTYQGNMPSWLGYIAVFMLSLYLAVYPAFACMGAHWFTGKFVASGSEEIGNDNAGPTFKNQSAGKFAFAFAFAGFWILTEWLRSWVFTGFAWNPLSVAFVDVGILQPLPMIGTYGASGLVILLTTTLLWLLGHIISRQWGSAAGSLAGLAALALFAAVAGWLGAGTPQPQSDMTVTIVQPGISQEDRNDGLMADENVAKLIRHSGPPSDKKRLLLWPESAVPWYMESGYPFRFYQFQPGDNAETTRQAIAQLLGPNDLLVTGNDRLIIDDKGQLVGAHNSVAAMDAGGDILDWYNKAHLVPYGEYLALRWILEPLGAARLVPGSIDFWPGPGPQTLSLGKGSPNIGVQICYEIIFSGQVVEAGKRPDFIFNPSNDAWFGHIGPPQHLAQARLRAAEEGLPVLRSTPTGVSAIIDANGKVVKSIAQGKTGNIKARLPAATSPSFFARWGNILPIALGLLLIFATMIPVARQRKHR